MLVREAQREKRRYDILEKSLDLFIRKGYAATKITDIAKAVDMSTGLLFHYYASKERLYEALIRSGLTVTQYVMTLDKSNPIEFFTEVTQTVFDFANTNTYATKMFVFMEQAQHNEVVSKHIQELLAQVNNIEISVPLIEQGQREETIKEGSPYALSIAFWCAIQGVMQELALSPKYECPKPEWIVDILKKNN